MSPDDRNFLARWSARKRAAARNAAREPPEGEPPAPDQAHPAPVEEPPFDPARLPPLSSISAESDIRAFLAQGIPAEVKRAALRRAWVTDPAIRDFVGLSENAWDFNTPETVPGFGALNAEVAKKLLAQAMGLGEDPSARRAEPQDPEIPAPADEPNTPSHESETAGKEARQESGTALAAPAPPRDEAKPLGRRRHGSAIPKS